MRNCRLSSYDFYCKFIRIFPEFLSFTNKEIVIIKKLIRKDSFILDIGCGWGREMRLLAPFCKKIIGIDIDPLEVNYAKFYLNHFKNIKLFVKDASKTNFPKNYFDIVIMTGSAFGNLGNKKGVVLKEIKRLIKGDGMVLISIYKKNANSKRILAYKKMGFNAVLRRGKIKLDNLFISEGFNKQTLNRIFIHFGFKVKFRDLNSIAMLCILTKNLKPKGLNRGRYH